MKADGAQILAVCWECLNNSFGLSISINSKLTLRNRGIYEKVAVTLGGVGLDTKNAQLT